MDFRLGKSWPECVTEHDFEGLMHREWRRLCSWAGDWSDISGADELGEQHKKANVGLLDSNHVGDKRSENE